MECIRAKHSSVVGSYPCNRMCPWFWEGEERVGRKSIWSVCTETDLKIFFSRKLSGKSLRLQETCRQ